MLDTSLPMWVFVFLTSQVFLEGIEELFILPTAWEYVKSLGETKTYLGAVLGSYALMNMIVNPIIGKLHDTFGYTKLIIVSSCFFKALAQIIYSIPHKACPLIGRILSGTASACFGVIFDVIASSTPESVRGRAFVILDGIFTIGTVTGPVIGSFLTFKVNIFGWKINYGNASSFVLAVVFSLLFVASLWLPKEFSKSNDEANTDLLSKDREHQVKKSYASNSAILCALFQIFMYVFLPSICQFYMPLFAKERFHLQLIHVKLLFLLFCLVVFVTEIVIYLKSGPSSEKKCFRVMFFFEVGAIGVTLLLAVAWRDTSTNNSYILMVYAMAGATGYSSFPVGCSMVAKITDPKHSSFYQGCCFSSLFLGALAGRFISGFIFTETSLLYYTIAQFVMLLISFLWLCWEYPNLDGGKIE